MNEHLITINKKSKRLQKPAIQKNEEEEEKEERESLSAPYSEHAVWVGKGVIVNAIRVRVRSGWCFIC